MEREEVLDGGRLAVLLHIAVRGIDVTTDRQQVALNQAAGFLRNGLFKRLHIHTVPTLHFMFDRTSERAADMNALIARAVASRAKDDEEA